MQTYNQTQSPVYKIEGNGINGYVSR